MAVQEDQNKRGMFFLSRNGVFNMENVPSVQYNKAGTLRVIIQTLLNRIGKKLFGTILLLLVLILFVTLAMTMGVFGGVGGFQEALPVVKTTLLGLPAALAPGSELMEEMWLVLGRSMGLLVLGLVLGVMSGLLLGGWAAVKRRSRISVLIQTGAVLGISTPSYFAAMLLIWLVVWIYQRTDVRILPVFGFGWDLHVILPMLVLATRPLANMTRLTYAALVEIFDSDFVRTAHSKGVKPGGVFWRHVLRNAGIPLLTTAGVSFRFSLALLPVVEYIFSWPGIGLTLLEAAQAGQVERVVVMVLPLAVLFVVVNLVLEVLYPVVDPRMRGQEEVVFE